MEIAEHAEITEIAEFSRNFSAPSIISACSAFSMPFSFRHFKSQTGGEYFEGGGQMNMRVDPVCGMTVDTATAAGKFDYEGETYYFCSPNCLRKFSADPQAYLNRLPQPAAMRNVMTQPMAQLSGRPPSSGVITPASANVEYACPMDPEVRQPVPGVCPKCGMTLELANSVTPATKTEYVCPMHPQ